MLFSKLWPPPLLLFMFILVSPLEKTMATHSSTLAWKIPWTEEPCRLSRTQMSNFTFTFHFHALEKEMVTHSSVLAWRIPGMGEPGTLPVYRVAQSRTRLQRLSSSRITLSMRSPLTTLFWIATLPEQFWSPSSIFPPQNLYLLIYLFILFTATPHLPLQPK